MESKDLKSKCEKINELSDLQQRINDAFGNLDQEKIFNLIIEIINLFNRKFNKTLLYIQPALPIEIRVSDIISHTFKMIECDIKKMQLKQTYQIVFPLDHQFVTIDINISSQNVIFYNYWYPDSDSTKFLEENNMHDTPVNFNIPSIMGNNLNKKMKDNSNI